MLPSAPGSGFGCLTHTPISEPGCDQRVAFPINGISGPYPKGFAQVWWMHSIEQKSISRTLPMDESTFSVEQRLKPTRDNFNATPLKFDPLRFCRLPRTPNAERDVIIANAAYLRAKRRGFKAGHELEDWLGAEAEFDQPLTR
jgi:hypothetical protein